MVSITEIHKAKGDRRKLKGMLGFIVDYEAIGLFDNYECSIISWINSDLYLTTKVIIDSNYELTEFIVTVNKDVNTIFDQYHVTLD